MNTFQDNYIRLLYYKTNYKIFELLNAAKVIK